MRGKRFVEKFLDTGKKVDPLLRADRQEKRNRATPGSTFLPESAGFYFFHALYIPEPVGTSPCQLIHLPDPFCHIPFFEKAKFRNLEISRPCSGPFPKFGIPGRPILILNSGLKAYQKMVTAMALWEVNQNRQGCVEFTFYFLFQPENQKWKTLRI